MATKPQDKQGNAGQKPPTPQNATRQRHQLGEPKGAPAKKAP